MCPPGETPARLLPFYKYWSSLSSESLFYLEAIAQAGVLLGLFTVHSWDLGEHTSVLYRLFVLQWAIKFFISDPGTYYAMPVLKRPAASLKLVKLQVWKSYSLCGSSQCYK